MCLRVCMPVFLHVYSCVCMFASACVCEREQKAKKKEKQRKKTKEKTRTHLEKVSKYARIGQGGLEAVVARCRPGSERAFQVPHAALVMTPIITVTNAVERRNEIRK